MVEDSPTNLMKMCVKLLQQRLGAEVDKVEDARTAEELVHAMLQQQALQSLSPSRRSASCIASTTFPRTTAAKTATYFIRLKIVFPVREVDSDDPGIQTIYDFVLMENLMPHMTGRGRWDIRVSSSVQEIAEYMAQGANAVLKKPFVLAALFSTLRQIDANTRIAEYNRPDRRLFCLTLYSKYSIYREYKRIAH